MLDNAAAAEELVTSHQSEHCHQQQSVHARLLSSISRQVRVHACAGHGGLLVAAVAHAMVVICHDDGSLAAQLATIIMPYSSQLHFVRSWRSTIRFSIGAGVSSVLLSNTVRLVLHSELHDIVRLELLDVVISDRTSRRWNPSHDQPQLKHRALLSSRRLDNNPESRLRTTTRHTHQGGDLYT